MNKTEWDAVPLFQNCSCVQERLSWGKGHLFLPPQTATTNYSDRSHPQPLAGVLPESGRSKSQNKALSSPCSTGGDGSSGSLLQPGRLADIPPVASQSCTRKQTRQRETAPGSNVLLLTQQPSRLTSAKPQSEGPRGAAEVGVRTHGLGVCLICGLSPSI